MLNVANIANYVTNCFAVGENGGAHQFSVDEIDHFLPELIGKNAFGAGFIPDLHGGEQLLIGIHDLSKKGCVKRLRLR